MNLDSDIVKKRDDFKKEIRKEQIEKKRVDMRLILPYYEAMFNTGIISRSTRFPVPSNHQQQSHGQNDRTGPHREENDGNWDIDQNLSETLCQKNYIEYLRNMANSQISQEERRQKINSEFTKMYGNDCFNFMHDLIDKISVNLMELEHDLISDRDETFEKLDWQFVSAVLYFAEHQKLSNIKQKCLSLMANYFISWSLGNIQSKIVEKMPLSDFLNILSDTNEDLRMIENIVLSQFIQLSQKHEVDEQKLSNIIKYFSQKFSMFETLQKHLQNSYEQESVYFSQITYDFPTLYFIETLAQTISMKETSTSLKLLALTLINNYFANYPENVENETQTNGKLKIITSGHLNQLKMFFKLCESGERVINGGLDWLVIVQSSLRFMKSMIWRDFDDEELLEDTVILFTKIVNLVVKIGATQDIIEGLSLHSEILEFFMIVFIITEEVKAVFEKSTILDYLNALLLEWHNLKNHIRKNDMPLETNSQNMNKFMNMELLMTQCLYLTKQKISSVEFSQADQQWIQGMFKYADVVYEKERRMMINSKKMDQEGMMAKNVLLFEKCIKLYFELMKNEKDVFNPEASEQQYNQEDVEI